MVLLFVFIGEIEVLLRSRAIETQCYVVAAAQVGQHSEKRISYGHAMVSDLLSLLKKWTTTDA